MIQNKNLLAFVRKVLYIGTSDILSQYLPHHIFKLFALSRIVAQLFRFSSRLRRGEIALTRRQSQPFVLKDSGLNLLALYEITSE